MSGELTVPYPTLRRWGFFGLVGATAAVAVALMAANVAAGGVSALEWVILLLFAPTFTWIVVPFWTALVGFALRVLGRDPLTLRRVSAPSDGPAVPDVDTAAPSTRTALVVPVRNEDPDAVGARIDAMAASVAEVGWTDRFHVHLLSDTDDPEVAAGEERAVARLRAAHPRLPLSYRRRVRNEGRKAGNIGEFCARCGDDHDFMVVLDADSLMTGTALATLVRTLEANPGVGLIQTLPLPARQRTLFGRLVQFGAATYAPLLAAGYAFWQGDAANYWGHNAIVRVAPFREHAVLPVLPGRPPLGGPVLSHDFVEAALLRRAGWRTLFLPSLAGSWEEVPGTLVDFARRDRRWAQGSLQHLRLLAEPGLHPLSRVHFLLGAMGYVASFLWLLILVAGTLWVLAPEAATWASRPTPFPVPWSGASLLGVTAVVLFLPRVLGAISVLAGDRAGFGGTVRFIGSALLETAFTVVVAPVLMLWHSRFVLEILSGRAVGWGSPARDGASVPWSDAVRSAGPATLVGVAWTAVTLALSPAFTLWMSPILVGLVLAVPLVRWTSSPALGRWTRRAGWFLAPAEIRPDPVLRAVPPAGSDPPRHTGVVEPAAPSPHDSLRFPTTSMHNAERGLFELQRNRALLVTHAGPAPDGGEDAGVVVASVEGLDDHALEDVRALGGGPVRLVVTRHRVAALGLEPVRTNGHAPSCYAWELAPDVDAAAVHRMAVGHQSPGPGPASVPCPAGEAEAGGLLLARMGRMLPAVVAATVTPPLRPSLRARLGDGAILQVSSHEVRAFLDADAGQVVRVSEATVPLPDTPDARFILFREPSGLQDHVAIVVGDQEDWPDPVPVRLHSACLTGDLFGSLRCDCGEQLRGSLEWFAGRGGGVLLYLAQEGRGIGLGNKLRAYTLQETGLDTIDADGTLGFGADERDYAVAASMLKRLGLRRIELLTNNPEKVRAMEAAGIVVARRQPLHGTLTPHNLPYVRAKVQRAGHLLDDMLSQPLVGD